MYGEHLAVVNYDHFEQFSTQIFDRTSHRRRRQVKCESTLLGWTI